MAFDTYGATGRTADSYKVLNEGKDLSKEYNYDELWEALFKSPSSPIPQALTQKHRIVVVDADAVVYRISAACEKKSVVAVVNGKSLRFKTKTKLKEHCDKIGVDYFSIDFVDEVEVAPVANAYETLRKTVAKIYRELDATHVIFMLGGSYNFRTDLKLPSLYKGNRKVTRRPEHLQKCREYLNKYYDTFIVSGIEADDCVQGITEYIINRKKVYACAYQLDKDFHTSMTPNRYWHIDKKCVIELKGGIGKLERTSSGLKGEGLHWVLYQLMQGDPSDGYSPKVLYQAPYKGKYGEVKYYNDFKDFKNGRELLKFWVDKWQDLLGDSIGFTDFNGEKQTHSWLSLAELYFQCLYMRMSPVDDMTFENLLLKYGLKVNKKNGCLEEFELPKELEELVEEGDEDIEVIQVVTNLDHWGWDD